MENTPLNGTTTTTPKNRDWKQKEGYGPIMAVSLALLLGLSFYLGDHLGGGTTLYRDEKETQNVAASSSSTSLMGSGTAASDLKTLTIEIDDDATIDGLLSGWPPAEKRMGGSSAYCKKNTGYNCGAVFPPNGNTCSQKGCCCHVEDGTGFKLNTCDKAEGYAYRGCNSCWGTDACQGTSNINVGTSSCHGKHSCRYVHDSTINNDSCHGELACDNVRNNATIHDGSCHGGYSCYGVQNATIGIGSCNEGSDSSSRYSKYDYAYSCEYVVNVKIGNNSCNGDKVCYKCKHNVPDNACNQGVTADMTTGGYCNYCGEPPDFVQ